MLEDYLSREATVQEELLSGGEGIKQAARDRKRKTQGQIAQTERIMAEKNARA